MVELLNIIIKCEFLYDEYEFFKVREVLRYFDILSCIGAGTGN